MTYYLHDYLGIILERRDEQPEPPPERLMATVDNERCGFFLVQKKPETAHYRMVMRVVK